MFRKWPIYRRPNQRWKTCVWVWWYIEFICYPCRLDARRCRVVAMNTGWMGGTKMEFWLDNEHQQFSKHMRENPIFWINTSEGPQIRPLLSKTAAMEIPGCLETPRKIYEFAEPDVILHQKIRLYHPQPFRVRISEKREMRFLWKRKMRMGECWYRSFCTIGRYGRQR
jgi:hypothetical protein